MVQSALHHFVPEQHEIELPSLYPKQPYLAAIQQLSSRVANVEALFDENGRLRTLSTIDPQGLLAEKLSGQPGDIAMRFVANEQIANALGLRNVELIYSGSVEIPNLGQRVELRQVLSVNNQAYPVRAGYVHVFMDSKGKIFQVNSTVRRGRRPLSLDKIISKGEAIARAKQSLGVSDVLTQNAELVLSSHNDRIDPVYEVILTTHSPRKVVLCLVRAVTGQVVHKSNKLRNRNPKREIPGDVKIKIDPQTGESGNGASGKSGFSAPVQAKTFLEIPDPQVAVIKQIHDALLDMLPDSSVLSNDNCVIYLGNRKRLVKAKSDGTFNYKPGELEFSAVISFFAFNAQMELYKSWGMVPPEKPIPIYVNDPTVSDNAYFDPQAYEIHLGIGTGLPAGLAKNIAYDLGVTWHENGHHVVFLQTPGNDLPGAEGGAIHESIGDVLGDLLMDFWFRLTYGTQLGKTLTVADVEADPRIIGKYAAAPHGIRNLKKKKYRTPQDKTGEPHDDGLISGGAKADLLVAMVRAATSLKQGLQDFGQLTLSALALVPAHKVSFQDLLKAYLTADQQLFNSANASLIRKAFADHGIVQKTGSRRGSPRIVIK